MVSVRGPAIASDQFDLASEPGETGEQEKDVSFEGRAIDEVSGEIERRMIEDALGKHHWNKQKTAQALGLSRQGLGKKLKKLGLARFERHNQTGDLENADQATLVGRGPCDYRV